MTKSVKGIPSGYPGVTPYLSVNGAAQAIDFYVKAFGARERMRMDMPDGKVGHAELEIGTGLVMLADEFPEMGFRSPRSLGGTPVGLHVYVEDVDSFIQRAVAAGAKLTRPPKNQFYGDRLGQIEDPFGHSWSISTQIEELTPEEMKARMAQHGSGE